LRISAPSKKRTPGRPETEPNRVMRTNYSSSAPHFHSSRKPMGKSRTTDESDSETRDFVFLTPCHFWPIPTNDPRGGNGFCTWGVCLTRGENKRTGQTIVSQTMVSNRACRREGKGVNGWPLHPGGGAPRAAARARRGGGRMSRVCPKRLGAASGLGGGGGGPGGRRHTRAGCEGANGAGGPAMARAFGLRWDNQDAGVARAGKRTARGERRTSDFARDCEQGGKRLEARRMVRALSRAARGTLAFITDETKLTWHQPWPERRPGDGIAGCRPCQLFGFLAPARKRKKKGRLGPGRRSAGARVWLNHRRAGRGERTAGACPLVAICSMKKRGVPLGVARHSCRLAMERPAGDPPS